MNRIAQFHNAMGILSAKRLVKPTPDRSLLRARLLVEEVVELLHAMGAKDPESLIDKLMDSKNDPTIKIEAGDEFTDEVDMPGCAHELADVVVVALGTADSMGIKLSPCFDEIMDSNMTKLGPDGKPLRRSDGKLEKGPNYRKPNLTQHLYPNE
jgi:predicted HAD superfamily Cof-like phosphohydrolase